ncbi:TonB-dependent siderophore receptor [Methylomonas sp. MO1]|uniref:TonB-dependent siderophore receptor n=1 Tax=Methylomonas sp. MO1 TaxID=3073619 RepID=UPI0028A4B275|nr:TonB-dependent siderophore receptor [Methylomonas sp. MO1]MDT4291076.1 TonB-dependent siderophore receptor [Methylomonas sp. MO1]
MLNAKYCKTVSGNKSRHHAAKAALLAALMSQTAHSDTAGKQHFDIPAQSLNQALLMFGRQSQQQLMYGTDIADNLRSRNLQGDYTADEAIRILLGDAPLQAVTTGEGAVTLQPRAAELHNNLGPQTMPAVQVVGKAVYDATDPYNPDYRLPNAMTATKTDTPIMETPMSIKVIPQQVLKDQQVVSIDQALRNVSSVTNGAEINKQFFIRGFETFNYYRDGFPFINNWHHTEELANIDRVEVLKGPGSILYGRAEPGGIINFVTKQPLDTPYYSLRQQFGSYNHYRTDIDATGPLTENKDLAYRINFAYQANDSITEFAGGERTFVAPMLRWNISDKTVSTFKLEYSNIKTFGRNLLLLNSDGSQIGGGNRRQNLSDPWDFSEEEYIMFAMNTDHRFNENWTLHHRFNASFSEQTLRQINATGPVAANGDVSRFFFQQNANGDDYFNNFYNSLELSGKFTTGDFKHTLLIGGDYMRTDSRATMGPVFGFSPSGTNINNPFHFTEAPAITQFNTFGYTQPWFGVYGQDQIELPYHLHLLAGLRYDNAETGGDSAFGAFGDNTKIINPTITDDRVSPRGGILWQALPELSLYGSYTENFGASNAAYVTQNGERLSPQTAQQWETGVKTELFDGRFTGTLAYYDLKKQNLPMQVTQAGNSFRAVGEAESRGIELDFSGEILPGWRVIGAYSYMPFAKTLKDSETAGTIGKRPHNAPEHNGNLWTTYEFQDASLHGLKLGAGLQAVSRREIGFTESIKAPGYATLNLMASKLWKVCDTRVTAQINADNLLDKTYLGGLYTFGTAVYGAPRTFVGSIKIEY